MTSKNTSSSVSIEIPEGLADGLRNYWYPLMVSTDLPDDKPIGIRRLGEDLVVWRGSDGKPCLFTGHCPHRCAALSKARLVNGRLECWYHGLQFDETGQCRRVPVEREDDGPQTRHYKVASYPCEERHEFIWGYIGDVEKFPPPPLQMEPEVEGGEYNVSPFDLGYIWEAALFGRTAVPAKRLDFVSFHPLALEIQTGQLVLRPYKSLFSGKSIPFRGFAWVAGHNLPPIKYRTEIILRQRITLLGGEPIPFERLGAIARGAQMVSPLPDAYIVPRL